jgi:hypothetical protein
MFYDFAAILCNKRGHLIEDHMNVKRYFTEFKINIQGDRTVTQPISDTSSIYKKINYVENKKRKQCYIKCWRCSPRLAMHIFTFSHATR